MKLEHTIKRKVVVRIEEASQCLIMQKGHPTNAIITVCSVVVVRSLIPSLRQTRIRENILGKDDTTMLGSIENIAAWIEQSG